MLSVSQIGKVAGLVIGVMGMTGLGLLGALRRPLPRTSGRLRVPGLRSPVQVIRDRWNIPHIYAQNTPDLFLAQGYIHAQDRLWQMELQRRTGHGRLAEMFGPVALNADRFLRVLGFSRVAQREADLLSDQTASIIAAYTQGVNAFIEQHIHRLPIEFTLLRLTPRPWVSADVLVWGKVMSLNLSANWTEEILRAQIVAAVGAERATALNPCYHDEHPLTIPIGVRYTSNMGKAALDAATAVAPFTGGGDTAQGSNAWAVGGRRSVSGRPLLANDTHLAVQMPALWYENHLSGGDYQVAGASIPGVPGVLIGHNERIAWGITNGMIDCQDLYIERFDPHDTTRYEFRGVWEQAEIINEEIVVRGRSTPVVEEVRITRHGPLVTSLIPHRNRPADLPSTASSVALQEHLALRWTALEPVQTHEAILCINRAHDWSSFREALSSWTVPSQNFVYADVDGHIGYALAGAVPLRARGDGQLPIPGWAGEYEWTGFIPHDELPHVLDPDEDLVVSANNRIVDQTYQYPIAGEWLSGYRVARIRQLLEQSPAHDVGSFARAQCDLRSIPGLVMAGLAWRLPATSVTAQHARDLLAGWDGELTLDSVAGAIYARLRDQLLMNAYAEVVEPLGTVAGLSAFASLPGIRYVARALPQVLQRLANHDDTWLPVGRSWDDVLCEAWNATITELRAQFGDDVTRWRYGQFHQVTFRHALGTIRALAPLFNRGPFPTGGDLDTVCMGHLPRRFAGPPFYTAPTYRLLCDLSDWDRCESIYPGGQSGQPGSRHYADGIQLWLSMQYHPLVWSRTRVIQEASSVLTLC